MSTADQRAERIEKWAARHDVPFVRPLRSGEEVALLLPSGMTAPDWMLAVALIPARAKPECRAIWEKTFGRAITGDVLVVRVA